jgi:hypothetical protein
VRGRARLGRALRPKQARPRAKGQGAANDYHPQQPQLALPSPRPDTPTRPNQTQAPRTNSHRPHSTSPSPVPALFQCCVRVQQSRMSNYARVPQQEESIEMKGPSAPVHKAEEPAPPLHMVVFSVGFYLVAAIVVSPGPGRVRWVGATGLTRALTGNSDGHGEQGTLRTSTPSRWRCLRMLECYC